MQINGIIKSMLVDTSKFRQICDILFGTEGVEKFKRTSQLFFILFMKSKWYFLNCSRVILFFNFYNHSYFHFYQFFYPFYYITFLVKSPWTELSRKY